MSMDGTGAKKVIPADMDFFEITVDKSEGSVRWYMDLRDKVRRAYGSSIVCRAEVVDDVRDISLRDAARMIHRYRESDEVRGPMPTYGDQIHYDPFERLE